VVAGPGAAVPRNGHGRHHDNGRNGERKQ